MFTAVTKGCLKGLGKAVLGCIESLQIVLYIAYRTVIKLNNEINITYPTSLKLLHGLY